MKQYFTISDIHGRPISLDMFTFLGFDIENPNHYMVCLGDYFDRWTNNKQVMTFFMNMKKQLQDRCILICGNHDLFMMNFIGKIETSCVVGEPIEFDADNYVRWMYNGGYASVKELFGAVPGIYTKAKQRRLQLMKQFVNLLEPYYETPSFIFTHAGINEQRVVDTWDRDFFHKGIKTDKTVVIGHTTHPYLLDVATFESWDIEVNGTVIESYCTLAKSKHDTLCTVYDIDTGLGNNIVVFTEES